MGDIIRSAAVPMDMFVEVIGTAQPKGSLFGQSQDNYVSIPVSTYFKIYGDRSGIGYNFQARNRDTLQQTVDDFAHEVRALKGHKD